jgi:glucose-1-phosphate cytidylyltransferase
MKVVILAGGYGTRISEESHLRPKPMIEIGGRPILWHIMKIYASHGFNDFVVCCGYKGYLIKEYFANYYLHVSDVMFDLGKNRVDILQNSAEPWHVTLVDTGDTTATGGRLRRVRHLVEAEPFCFTYGDGVSNVDIAALVEFHRAQGRLATVTAVQPPGRFGALDISEQRITGFEEKPLGDAGWINGGFFVLSPKVMDYIDGDSCTWEREPMERLATEGQLSAYQHRGFWHPMDTLRDRNHLEELWATGNPPWKTWA